jgi:hypothetical protein
MVARPQNRRRQRVEKPSRADTRSPAKQIQTRSERELEAWWSWEYPPKFWDKLSKVHLTRKAVRELDRRTQARRSRPSHSQRLIQPTNRSRDLARFASRGGPDLGHIKGVSSVARCANNFLTSLFSILIQQANINSLSP